MTPCTRRARRPGPGTPDGCSRARGRSAPGPRRCSPGPPRGRRGRGSVGSMSVHSAWGKVCMSAAASTIVMSARRTTMPRSIEVEVARPEGRHRPRAARRGGSRPRRSSRRAGTPPGRWCGGGRGPRRSPAVGAARQGWALRAQAPGDCGAPTGGGRQRHLVEAVQDGRVAVPPDAGHRGGAQVEAPIEIAGPERPGHGRLDRASRGSPRPRRRRRGAAPAPSACEELLTGGRDALGRPRPGSRRPRAGSRGPRCQRRQTSAGMPPRGWHSYSP